jgi:SAM-dependent methyltransferase
MLTRARARAAGLAHVSFIEADAAKHDFALRADLLFSRFGVMFFADPVLAFSNLRRALAPQGRVAFICWRALEDNPWLGVPFAAVRRIAAADVPLPPPDAPGPLAFADPERVRHILTRAGFSDVALAPFDHVMPLGDHKGLDAAVDQALTFGPTARLLAAVNADEATLVRVRHAVRESLAPYAVADDVSLAAGAWIVSAR